MRRNPQFSSAFRLCQSQQTVPPNAPPLMTLCALFASSKEMYWDIPYGRVSKPPGVTLESSLMPKRVLVVDDSEPVRQALQDLIANETELEICAEAANGREAIEAAERSIPDLIILDVSMPVMNGLEAAPILIKTLPSVIVMLFTMYESPELRAQARSLGVRAVVSKAGVHKLLEQARLLLGIEDPLKRHTARVLTEPA